ncbi:PAS domain S-box protein [Flavobacterium glaciei]|uniref:histidine kinase n=1 Tax=Flavobacterium glaciei TaxID=386300 RepID=A0A562PU60_9FLAO|nr:PAS domain S-box protein [Flavobacterium glaciei]RDI55031.1 PAS domain S-box-containing protein [Flavobacterium glaciei]TWI47939.1 PAS domain S-box-containing protein [Flavobacterium glaciei]
MTFLFLSYVVTFIVAQQYKIIKENEQREMVNILNVVHQNIEQALKNCYTTTLSLALTINDKGIPKNYEFVSEKLIESNPNISAVQLVPNGIIKYVYPYKGNEAAINLNILTTPHLKREALKSIAKKKMYFAGPFELKQGGMEIVGRFPVFQNNKFWGFSAVIIKLETFLKASGIKNIDDSKYYFQFSKYDIEKKQEVFYLPNKIDFSKNYSINRLIPDGDWKLYLIKKNKNYLCLQILFPGLLGITLAGLFGFLIFTLLKIPEELQTLVTTQTSKLLNSEIKFKAIFDQAAVGIANVDITTGNFLEINNKFCELLGYTQDEMKNKNFQSITHPDDLKNDLINVNKLENRIINEYSMEKRYFTKSGKTIWVNLNVTPIVDKSKNQISAISIVEDITLKKEAEELIIKSQIRFKSLFEDSPIPLWEEDFSGVKKYLQELELINQSPETVALYLKMHPDVVQKCISLVKIIDVNTICLRLHKVKNKEELISDLSQIIDTDSIRDFTKQLIAITQGDKQLIVDTKIKNKNGEYRNVNLRWNVIHGYEKSLERIIVSTEDITERKISENIILQSQQRIESLINTIDGIVWECDAKSFNFSFISQKVENILGYTAEEWLSSKTFWIDHIHPEDKQWTIDYCTLKTNKILNHDFEYRMIAKNGAVVWLKDIVNVISENDQPLNLRGIMIDITTMKEAEKDLNEAFNLVTEQNKRLLNFSYIVSHNLRSHTSNIASIMSLIESSETEEEKDEMIQLLKSVSNSLNETMIHLNEVINIRTNIGLVSESLNLKQYIENVLNVLSEQINSKDVSISINMPNNVMVNYNPAYLESILYNIISNCIRYSHPDRKPIITIKWITNYDDKILQITDNGIGIDLVKNADKIFGMYKTFTNNADSRGIGLFITKNQIDAMGGDITVESELNIGTTFKIYIK